MTDLAEQIAEAQRQRDEAKERHRQLLQRFRENLTAGTNVAITDQGSEPYTFLSFTGPKMCLIVGSSGKEEPMALSQLHPWTRELQLRWSKRQRWAAVCERFAQYRKNGGPSEILEALESLFGIDASSDEKETNHADPQHQ